MRAVARGVLLEACKLLHPVMPFITEEIASHLGHAGMLMTTAYPQDGDRTIDAGALEVMRGVQAVIQEVRSYRHLVGLPPGTPLAVYLPDLPATWRAEFEAMDREVCRLASLEALHLDGEPPAGAVRDVAGGVHLALVLPAGAIGDAERVRLAIELDQVEEELGRLRARLADEAFVARAPQDVVEGSRSRGRELEHKAAMLAATLEG